MKILMLNHEFPPYGGGAGHAMSNFSRELVKEGHDISVLTSKYSGDKSYEEIDGVKVYRVFSFRKSIHESSSVGIILYLFFGFIAYRRILKNEKFDRVYAFFSVPSGLIAYIGKKLYDVDYAVLLRGSDVPGFDSHKWNVVYSLFKSLIIRIWKNAVIVVPNSYALGELARESLDIKYKIVYNGIDINKFYPVRTERKHKGQKIRLISVSRIIKRKGFQYLFRALSEISSRNSFDYELLIVGVGEYQDTLESLAEDFEISDKIKFVGYVNNTKLVKLYNSSDIFVLPSLAEGMSNSVLEAMACGLPLIVTDVGGSRELVDGNGIVVAPKDSDALINALSSLATKSVLRDKMGCKSEEIAKKKFSWSRVTQDFVSVW
ncbi:MAG: glycosyltransferase family 4 protein [Candidatus Aenigmarchaeota archaeon]|nr:glycosyltransferase family 4 protein [Candidatus Aenigmarchaeota archaeon]